eukprot:3917872-Pyramimonas_sp.AAC.1
MSFWAVPLQAAPMQLLEPCSSEAGWLGLVVLLLLPQEAGGPCRCLLCASWPAAARALGLAA